MKHIVIEKSTIIEDKVVLRGRYLHYLKNVRRVKVGDYIKALVEDKIMLLYINEIKRDRIILFITGKKKADNTINPEIMVFQSIIKSKKMDLLVSRLSEIGINSFNPIITERSILNRNIGKNKIERWQRLSKEGAKISGVERVLKINYPQKLEYIIDNSINDYGIKLLFSTAKEAKHLRIFLEGVENSKEMSFSLFFGPEGGFSLKEEKYLTNTGFIRVGMGPFTMRSETAAIAASTFIRIFYSANWS